MSTKTLEQTLTDYLFSHTEEKTPSLQEKLETLYPGWCTLELDGYSEDYPHLTKNWKVMCGKVGISPKKLLLVKNIEFDNKNDQKVDFTLRLCEVLTRKGYCVRRADEFLCCVHCELAIPCEQVWQKMRDNNMPVVSVWGNVCGGCRSVGV